MKFSTSWPIAAATPYPNVWCVRRRELASTPASVAHLQFTEPTTVATSTAVQTYMSCGLRFSDRLADEVLGLLDRILPSRLIPTSDPGGCPLVEYDPAIGLDGAERDLLHHNIQLSCRRTTSLDRLRLASPTPALGRSRCRKRNPHRTSRLFRIEPPKSIRSLRDELLPCSAVWAVRDALPES